MTAIDRFLRYVTYDTQSDEHSDAIPSTAKQKVLGAALAFALDAAASSLERSGEMRRIPQRL